MPFVVGPARHTNGRAAGRHGRDRARRPPRRRPVDRPHERALAFSEQIDASIVGERMLGVLSGFFAGLGLLLASVGLYGVMSYNVSRRTSEIGIRMALGAQPSRISRMVVREALMLTAGGRRGRASRARFSFRVRLASLLFGLTPTDPLTIWAWSSSCC